MRAVDAGGGRLSTNRTAAWIAVAVVLWCAFNWSFVIGLFGGGAVAAQRAAEVAAARDLAETLHEVLSAVPGSAEALAASKRAHRAAERALGAFGVHAPRVVQASTGGGSATAKDCDPSCIDVPPPDKWKQNTCELQLAKTSNCRTRREGTRTDGYCSATCGVCRPCAPEPPTPSTATGSRQRTSRIG